MAANTYVSLLTTNVASSVSSVTLDLTGISGYTDLVLVEYSRLSTAAHTGLQFNGDTGTNYSYMNLYGSGTAAGSGRTNSTQTLVGYGAVDGQGAASNYTHIIRHINNYSNTNMYKSVITMAHQTISEATLGSGLWRNTAAITSIKILASNSANILAGSTFTLYGIKKETNIGTKATGGIIYTDSTYAYHVFTSSGTFTPSTALTADVLIVAGGGSGAGSYGGGGGGAGGLRAFTSQSLTSGTGYTCTIGAGAKGGLANVNPNGSKGLQGSNTTFNSLSVTGGGGGASWGTNPSSSGGSGGGGGAEYLNGGAGNAGGYTPVEGYAGGQGYTTANYGMAGGGGAGGAASNASSGVSTAGGPGTNTYNSINFSSWLTATGMGTNGKLAGGGGGSGDITNVPNLIKANGTDGGGNGGDITNGGHGATATGSGGGAGGYPSGLIGGNGGSGLIIIRYAK